MILLLFGFTVVLISSEDQISTSQLVEFGVKNELTSGWLMNDNDSSLGVPDPPRNLQANMSEKEVILRWQTPLNDGGADIIEYRVYRSQTSGMCGTHTLGDRYLGNTTSLRFVDSAESKNGYIYWYVVTAINSEGESDFSEEASVSFPAKKAIGWSILLLISTIIFIVVIKRYKYWRRSK